MLDNKDLIEELNSIRKCMEYVEMRCKNDGLSKELATYNLARMNLLMNDVSYDRMTLKNADTLEQDWPDGVDAQGIDHP